MYYEKGGLLIIIMPTLVFFYLFLVMMFLSLLMFFYNKGYTIANRFLAGSLFFTSVYNLVIYCYLFSNSPYTIALVVATIPSVFFLIGPLSYFYIRSILLDNATLKRHDYAHFIIFGICFIGTIPFLFGSWQIKLQVANQIIHGNWDLTSFRINRIFSHRFNQVLRPLHLFFYLIQQWILIFKYYLKTAPRSKLRQQAKIINIWLILFITIYSFITLMFCAGMIQYFFAEGRAHFLKIAYNIIVAGAFGYTFLFLILLSFPQIIYGFPIARQNQVLHLPGVTATEEYDEALNSEITINQLKHENKALLLFSEDYVTSIRELINEYLLSKKHLSPDCSINSLSDLTNIPLHHLSYYFNNSLGVKFSDWRNNHRIEHAMFLLRNGALKNMSMEGIAAECGYNNQNTFIRAFKLKTGYTPSAFVKGECI